MLKQDNALLDRTKETDIDHYIQTYIFKYILLYRILAIGYQFGVSHPRKLIEYLIQCTLRGNKTINVSLIPCDLTEGLVLAVCRVLKIYTQYIIYIYNILIVGLIN